MRRKTLTHPRLERGSEDREPSDNTSERLTESEPCLESLVDPEEMDVSY